LSDSTVITVMALSVPNPPVPLGLHHSPRERLLYAFPLAPPALFLFPLPLQIRRTIKPVSWFSLTPPQSEVEPSLFPPSLFSPSGEKGTHQRKFAFPPFFFPPPTVRTTTQNRLSFCPHPFPVGIPKKGGGGDLFINFFFTLSTFVSSSLSCRSHLTEPTNSFPPPSSLNYGKPLLYFYRRRRNRCSCIG